MASLVIFHIQVEQILEEIRSYLKLCFSNVKIMCEKVGKVCEILDF